MVGMTDHHNCKVSYSLVFSRIRGGVLDDLKSEHLFTRGRSSAPNVSIYNYSEVLFSVLLSVLIIAYTTHHACVCAGEVRANS